MEQTIIQELESQHEILFSWLDGVSVTTDVEQKGAEDMLIVARKAVKEATDKRMELTRPLDESKKRIMELFQPYLDRLNYGITAVNIALGRWHEKKRAEAEAERLAALAEEAVRIADAHDAGEIIEPLSRPMVAAVEKTSRAHLGTVSYQPDWDIQVVDPNQVPRDLCEPSMPRIRARVKSGITSIPGVLVTRKYVTTTRVGGGKV